MKKSHVNDLLKSYIYTEHKHRMQEKLACRDRICLVDEM